MAAAKPRWVELTHVGYGAWARLMPGATEVGYSLIFSWRGTDFVGIAVEGKRGEPVTGVDKARTVTGKLGRLLVLPKEWRFLGVATLGYNAKGASFKMSLEGEGQVVQESPSAALVIAPIGAVVRVEYSAYYKDGKRSRPEAGTLCYRLTEEGVEELLLDEGERTFDLLGGL